MIGGGLLSHVVIVVVGQSIRSTEELVGDAGSLTETREKSAVDGGRVVADGVFACEEDPGRRKGMVGWMIRGLVADGRGHDFVVAA